MKKRTSKKLGRMLALLLAAVMMMSVLAACGGSDDEDTSSAADEETTASSEEDTESTEGSVMTTEEIITLAASEGKVGNWGSGNEYEVLALLAKYDLPTEFLSQDYTMDSFDDDTITLASAMTYNELGLTINDYDGGYGYGDTVGYIDMNDEGVGMLEDNIFCTREFAEENPNTVAAFLYASIKGWEYAVENPEEAAEICYEYGSSVSQDHQYYMADEVVKLVTTDMDGETVSDIGYIDTDAMAQTLEIAQTYVEIDDSEAAAVFAEMTVEDFCDSSYYEAAISSDGTFEVEQSEVSIQLKWLPDAQFMGYYCALALGYYDEVGLTVEIVSGGGDIAETTAVNSGTVDFGVTWPTNMAVANAGGMDLVEVAQIFQRSGLTLVYKYENFTE